MKITYVTKFKLCNILTKVDGSRGEGARRVIRHEVLIVVKFNR